MTNQEIDKRLALAIGWKSDQMQIHCSNLYVADWPRKSNRAAMLYDYKPPFLPWMRFDHTDPAVIWPIAERFAAFPAKGESLKDIWFAGQALGREFGKVCAASAVALAVIHYMESIRQGGDV